MSDRTAEGFKVVTTIIGMMIAVMILMYNATHYYYA